MYNDIGITYFVKKNNYVNYITNNLHFSKQLKSQ